MNVNTLFSRSAVLLDSSIKQAAGVRGTYMHDGNSISVIGTPGRIDQASGMIEDVAALDVDTVWIFAADDLLTAETTIIDRFGADVVDRFDDFVAGRTGSDVGTVPEEGDTWSFVTDRGATEYYRVLPPYSQQAVWQNMDSYGHLIRIYMKHYHTADA